MKELEGQLKIDQGKRLERRSTTKLRDDHRGDRQGAGLHPDPASAAIPDLIYSREALDITDLVVARFNQKKG